MHDYNKAFLCARGGVPQDDKPSVPSFSQIPTFFFVLCEVLHEVLHEILLRRRLFLRYHCTTIECAYPYIIANIYI
jgi:hypothetical protein